MFKILRLRYVSGPLAWVIIYSFVLMTSGCYYYRVTRSTAPPAAEISKMQDEKKTLVLHQQDKQWLFTGVIVNEDTIKGRTLPLPIHMIHNVSKQTGTMRYHKDDPSASYLLNEVHIYATGICRSDDGKTTLPVTGINKIEIYDKNSGATVASWVLGTLGVAVGALAIVTIIVALTKSSCPFVYARDESGMQFSGEIFSGATQPGLERDDYLPVGKLREHDGIYQVMLTNEVKEVQSVNLAELMVVNHPPETRVLIDKYGIVRTLKEPIPPSAAHNAASAI